MCRCGAVVILHFVQMDPLNPKPITGDLSSGPLQAGFLIGGCNHTFGGLPAAIGQSPGGQLGLVGAGRLPVALSHWLPPWR